MEPWAGGLCERATVKLLLLLLLFPAGAWYKHLVNPGYHTVGRGAHPTCGTAQHFQAPCLDTLGLRVHTQGPSARDTLYRRLLPAKLFCLPQGFGNHGRP